MIKGRVHSIETGGTVDGPGIRYIVFMQGCLMRCKYCHNRDTWDLEGGKEMTVDEVLDDLRCYRHYIDASGGGITASGGEATLQAEFIGELFRRCKEEGIHTCLDTNGFVHNYSPELLKILENTDLVMLDLKQLDDEKHIDLTHVSNRYAKQFAEYLHQHNIKTWIRYVVLDGYTSDERSIEMMADFIKGMDNIERVELLPYHKLGAHKWKEMGEEYQLEGIEPPSKETMNRCAEQLKQHNIPVVY